MQTVDVKFDFDLNIHLPWTSFLMSTTLVSVNEPDDSRWGRKGEIMVNFMDHVMIVSDMIPGEQTDKLQKYKYSLPLPLQGIPVSYIKITLVYLEAPEGSLFSSSPSTPLHSLAFEMRGASYTPKNAELYDRRLGNASKGDSSLGLPDLKDEKLHLSLLRTAGNHLASARVRQLSLELLVKIITPIKNVHEAMNHMYFGATDMGIIRCNVLGVGPSACYCDKGNCYEPERIDYDPEAPETVLKLYKLMDDGMQLEGSVVVQSLLILLQCRHTTLSACREADAGEVYAKIIATMLKHAPAECMLVLLSVLDRYGRQIGSIADKYSQFVWTFLKSDASALVATLYQKCQSDARLITNQTTSTTTASKPSTGGFYSTYSSTAGYKPANYTPAGSGFSFGTSAPSSSPLGGGTSSMWSAGPPASYSAAGSNTFSFSSTSSSAYAGKGESSQIRHISKTFRKEDCMRIGGLTVSKLADVHTKANSGGDNVVMKFTKLVKNNEYSIEIGLPGECILEGFILHWKFQYSIGKCTIDGYGGRFYNENFVPVVATYEGENLDEVLTTPSKNFAVRPLKEGEETAVEESKDEEKIVEGDDKKGKQKQENVSTTAPIQPIRLHIQEPLPACAQDKATVFSIGADKVLTPVSCGRVRRSFTSLKITISTSTTGSLAGTAQAGLEVYGQPLLGDVDQSLLVVQKEKEFLDEWQEYQLAIMNFQTVVDDTCQVHLISFSI